MKRRRVVAGALAALASVGTAAGVRGATAQPNGVARIGLVMGDDATPLVDELTAALRDLGWVEGGNLILERRGVADPLRQREAAAELQRLQVVLILANGTTGIRATRDGAPTTPIVMINAGDPVGAGFVASLARPGGLLTGTSAAGAEVLAKQLELLHAVARERRTVGVLMNRVNPANGFFYAALDATAKRLGLILRRVEVASAGDLEPALRRATVDALLVLGDPMFIRERQRLVELVAALRLPAMFGARLYVAAGGLISYNSAYAWHWRRAAVYVDKILKGAPPAQLPVEQPTQFELVINLKTARAIGIDVPQSLLLRADEVIG
jgi:putative ABC transport system substrate-binding protein